jgi:hypothetical protein
MVRAPWQTGEVFPQPLERAPHLCVGLEEPRRDEARVRRDSLGRLVRGSPGLAFMERCEGAKVRRECKPRELLLERAAKVEGLGRLAEAKQQQNLADRMNRIQWIKLAGAGEAVVTFLKVDREQGGETQRVGQRARGRPCLRWIDRTNGTPWSAVELQGER